MYLYIACLWPYTSCNERYKSLFGQRELRARVKLYFLGDPKTDAHEAREDEVVSREDAYRCGEVLIVGWGKGKENERKASR